MANFLVTGGCGFIGSHLVDELIKGGHHVRVLDNLSTGKLKNLADNVEFIEDDITNRRRVLECVDGMNGVFHLAAISSVQRTTEEWPECNTVNLTGSINIFDAAARAPGGPVRVVYTSSAAVYGDCSAPMLSETENPRPISAYGADKLGCELHARVATLLHKVPTIGLRPFNVYGPRQDPLSPYAGVIAIFAERMQQKLPIDIFGDGQQVRDFVFVRDAVKFFITAMGSDHAVGNIYNVCTGRGTSIVALAGILGQLYEVKPKICFRPSRQGDIQRSIGNPEAALRALGCRADTEIRLGLAQTVGAKVKMCDTSAETRIG